MPSLREVVTSVRHQLGGAGILTDQVTELGGALPAASTSIPVVDATGLGPGLYEIELEKIRVRTVDQAGSRLQAWTFGRGYDGTVARAHAPGAEVRVNPVWPTSTIAAAINGVLQEVYPTLYSVKTLDVDYLPPLQLPATSVGVVAVFRERGGAWDRLDRWRFEPGAGRGLDVPVERGTRLRVQYAQAPGLFDLQAADVMGLDYEEVTGLPARTSDLMALGVGYRLAPMLDLARLAQRGAEAKADGREAGQGSSLSRLLLGEFTARLQSEQLALHAEHPIRMHNVR